MAGGSFLDQLLVAATGSLRVYPSIVTAGQSVQALPGQLVLVDPTGGSASVSAPVGPAFGQVFGVADVTGQSASHAVNILSAGAAYVLEAPGSPGTYSNSVAIGSASRVRWWVYSSIVAGGTAGWKIYQGIF